MSKEKNRVFATHFLLEGTAARIFNAGNDIVKGTNIGPRAHPDYLYSF
jgi:hypothetical protein